MQTVGLRYFNVFGPRQDPNGAYAAVIPLWFASLIRGESVYINGDGETSRDFCYIDNCVQANILAATSQEDVGNQIFNIAYGERTTLNELFHLIRERVAKKMPQVMKIKPQYLDFREGDVRHSLADISKAREMLGYAPGYSVREGLARVDEWYLDIQPEIDCNRNFTVTP